MEIGRRFGNQVGDPLRFQRPDIRGTTAPAGFRVRGMNPTGVWSGAILAYVDGRKAGAFDQDPFFVSAPVRKRVWLEFFLAGRNNASEDVSRYLRTLPGDRFRLTWGRNGTGQASFRVYHTASLTAAPDVLLASFGNAQRDAGTTTTAATWAYVTPVLRTDKAHRFQIRPVDAAGNERTSCAILTGTLAPWPMPPTGVRVHAYNRTTGLVTVKWSHASGYVLTSVYRVYRNTGQDSRVRYGTAVSSAATAFPTTGSPPKVYATFTLPATGAAAVGTWLVGVRHRKHGIEEDNFSALAKFVLGADGSYAGSGYPNAPSYLSARPTAGGRIVVAIKHDAAGEAARALRFRVYRSPAGVSTIAYGTAIGTITRFGERFFEGTFHAGPLTHGGLFRFGVRAEATAGVREVNTAYATAVADSAPPGSCATAQAIAKVVG